MGGTEAPHMCVPEIPQVRVTAQAWNDASEYGRLSVLDTKPCDPSGPEAGFLCEHRASTHWDFFCLLTSCIRLSVCLEGVPVTQPRCHGDQSHTVSLAPSRFVPVVKISSVSRKIKTTKKASWCRCLG